MTYKIMKRAYYLIFILLFAVNSLSAQGVNFRSLTIDEAIATAKKEGKMVFVDLSMNGCGPCVYMSDSIFPKKEVGTFYNDKFVSVHYNVSVNKEAESFATKNSVKGFPTFIFIDPQTGNIVHELLGGGGVDRVMQMGTDAITPNKGSVYVIAKYIEGNRDFDTMKDFYLLQEQQGERAKMRLVVNEMAKIWGSEFKDDRFSEFFFQHVNFKDNVLAEYFLANSVKMIKKFGKENVYRKLPTLR